MENTTDVTPAKSTSSLFFSSLGRTIFALILSVAAALCLIFAGAYLIGTITSLPTLLYRSLTAPLQALLCTLVYLFAVLGVVAFSVSLFAIAYRLIKRHSITRWHFFTCLILLAFSCAIVFGAAPTFATFSSVSAYPHILQY